MWIEKWSLFKKAESWLRPIFSELYGNAECSPYIKAFLQKCLKITTAILVVGTVVVLAGGFGLVELAYVLVLSILCGAAPFLDVKKKLKERRFLIKKGLPDFISRLVLLIEAGMTLSRAFEISAGSVEKSSPLYFEILKTCNEIKNGIPEIQAYEQLSNRCRTIEIARFSSMLIQNLRKGNSELAALLRMVASECWNARKALARKRGEEAAAQMLIPVALLLIAVLIVTAGPALASLLNINTVQFGR